MTDVKHIMYVDGASRGNPGDASIGVSLQNDQGEELSFVSKSIGSTTNNTAEYMALIEGLKLAIEKNITMVEIRSDSQLMVRQLTGQYRVKESHIQALYNEVQDLLPSFEKILFIHIPREQNKRADQLANKALDEF